MLKKIVVVGVVLVFAVAVLGVSLLKTSWLVVQRSYPKISQSEGNSNDEKTENSKPGPGDLLYPIRMISDQIWLFTAFDKEIKTERLLSLANQRLESAKVLVKQGDYVVGLDTLIKGEQYLRLAGKNNNGSEPFATKYKLAVEDHGRTLNEILEKFPNKGVIENLVAENRQLQEQLK